MYAQLLRPLSKNGNSFLFWNFPPESRTFLPASSELSAELHSSTEGSYCFFLQCTLCACVIFIHLFTISRNARVVSEHHVFGRVSGGSDFPAGQMAVLCGQCICVCLSLSMCVCGRGAVRRGPAASWREDCSHSGSVLCPRAAVLLRPTWTFNLFNMWQRTPSKTEHMSGGWGSTGRDSKGRMTPRGVVF